MCTLFWWGSPRSFFKARGWGSLTLHRYKGKNVFSRSAERLWLPSPRCYVGHLVIRLYLHLCIAFSRTLTPHVSVQNLDNTLRNFRQRTFCLQHIKIYKARLSGQRVIFTQTGLYEKQLPNIFERIRKVQDCTLTSCRSISMFCTLAWKLPLYG